MDAQNCFLPLGLSLVYPLEVSAAQNNSKLTKQLWPLFKKANVSPITIRGVCKTIIAFLKSWAPVQPMYWQHDAASGFPFIFYSRNLFSLV